MGGGGSLEEQFGGNGVWGWDFAVLIGGVSCSRTDWVGLGALGVNLGTLGVNLGLE